MRITECLTSREWNACLYLCGRVFTSNFAEATQLTIRALLEAGYEFEGLDKDGRPHKAVDDGANLPKTKLWFGNPNNINVAEVYEDGRQFVETHLPDLLKDYQT